MIYSCRLHKKGANSAQYSRPQQLTFCNLSYYYIFGVFNVLCFLQPEEVVFFQTLAATHMDDKELIESIQKLLIVMQGLDDKIAPLLESDGELFNKRQYGACCCQFCLACSLPLLFQNIKLWLPHFLSGGVFSPEQACGTKAT